MLNKFYHASRPYHFLILLIASTLLGGLTGYLVGPAVSVLKPFGDIFLNLMFTLVVPLVFFSIASAVTTITHLANMWRILISMFFIFLLTSLIAACLMLLAVYFYPIGTGVLLPKTISALPHAVPLKDQLVNLLTVSEFTQLFSRDHMLAFIVFSLLVGIGTKAIGEKGLILVEFYKSGQALSMKLVDFVMYYAPIGFFAYFAVLVNDLGTTVLTTYLKATWLYCIIAVIYFTVFLSLYAFLAAKYCGVRQFWRYISYPAITSLATCSSAASIPPNLTAASNMRVPAEIYELVIPLGAMIHKDGSVLGAIVKIAFLFGMFHLNLFTPYALLLAIFVSLLVGTVMGAIPGGGMIGEILILSVYGFPPQALIIIAAISILIDAPATLLNVTSNTACSLLIARWVKGKNWLPAEKNVP